MNDDDDLTNDVLRGTVRKLQREMRDMANRAASEIEDERRVSERLQPKAEAYDTLRQVLGLLPKRGEGAKEDVAWQLRRRVKELDDELAPKRESPVADAYNAEDIDGLK